MLHFAGVLVLVAFITHLASACSATGGITTLEGGCFVSSPSNGNAHTKMKRVLVIGSNGQTGKRVVKFLQKSSAYVPIAMIRNLDQKPSFDSIGVQSVLGDLRFPIDHLLDSIDVVIFAAGGRTLNAKGYEGTVQIDLAGAIRAISSSQVANVTRFIMLSGINVAFDATSKITHWSRAKAYADTFLKDSSTFGRPLDWTIVCPSTLNNDPLPEATDLDGSGDSPNTEISLSSPAIVHPLTAVGQGAGGRPVGNTSRDLVAATLVSIIDMPNTYGKSFTLLDGTVKEGRSELVVEGMTIEPRPLGEALASL